MVIKVRLNLSNLKAALKKIIPERWFDKLKLIEH